MQGVVVMGGQGRRAGVQWGPAESTEQNLEVVTGVREKGREEHKEKGEKEKKSLSHICLPGPGCRGSPLNSVFIVCHLVPNTRLSMAPPHLTAPLLPSSGHLRDRNWKGWHASMLFLPEQSRAEGVLDQN